MNQLDATTQAVIIFIALVLSAGFLALVIVLVPAIRELRELLVSLRKTSDEVRGVAEDAKKLSSGVGEKLEGLGGIVANARKIASGLGSPSGNSSFRNLEWLALLPAILLGWKVVRNARRKKNERRQ